MWCQRDEMKIVSYCVICKYWQQWHADTDHHSAGTCKHASTHRRGFLDGRQIKELGIQSQADVLLSSVSLIVTTIVTILSRGGKKHSAANVMRIILAHG